MSGSNNARLFVTFLAVIALAGLAALPDALAEVFEADGITTVHVRYNAVTKSFAVDANESFGRIAGTVTVNNSFDATGWDVVDAAANAEFLAAAGSAEEAEALLRVAYRAIGYGEGYATQKRIAENINNTFLGDDGLDVLIAASPEGQKWVDAHINYMESVRKADDEFGRQLIHLMALIDGMADGYNARVGEKGTKISARRLFYLNFQAEFSDVVNAVATDEQLADLKERMPKQFADLHCSALVKIVPNDIYFSHVTWNSFNSMLRQYKTYRVGDKFVTMSSYPGMIHSIDDWYMTHQRLTVMETTNSVFNQSLYRDFVKPNTVSEFLRVMIANFIATDSPSWVKNFARENSGTYSNQFMVMNMGIVTDPNKKLPPNTFWVAEQLPGSEYPFGVTAADMTDFLNEKTYWPSYNTPYFPNVYNVSGYAQKFEEYGDFFSYTMYARARIFKRNHTDVVDLDTMKRMMRYNDYKNDPFSLITNCTGAGGNASSSGADGAKDTCDPPYSTFLTIASRGDLNPVGNASNYGPLYSYLGHMEFGATDAKIAVWSGMMKQGEKYTAHVVCGPTNDQQPTFVWTDGLFNPMPPLYGIPKTYDFPFMTYTTAAPFPKKPDDNGADDRNRWIGIGIGIGATIIVFTVVIVVIVRSYRAARYLDDEAVIMAK